jgi:hypothetical protein
VAPSGDHGEAVRGAILLMEDGVGPGQDGHDG